MYKFTKLKDSANVYDKADYEMEIDSMHLADLIDYFEDFLKGCGYDFDGHLRIVPDEDLPSE